MTITIPIEKLLPWLRTLLANVFVFLKRVISQIRTKPVRILIAIAIGVGMGLWLGARAGALWFLFVLFALYEWDNRAIGVVALVCLAACPILLSLKRDEAAEHVAVYAYFFLVMTVALQLIEYKRHSDRFEEKESEEPTI